MSLDIQKKFLRVLENGEFRRLGEARVRQASVRVVAATNRVMKDEVAAGRFREDLSYRLNVLSVRMPPLRDRISDVPLLVEHFLRRDGHRYPRGGASDRRRSRALHEVPLARERARAPERARARRRPLSRRDRAPRGLSGARARGASRAQLRRRSRPPPRPRLRERRARRPTT